jgi:4,5-dihydroxyphthalate decarboxylase
MPNLNLTLAMTPYDRVLPLINGEVKSDGISLEYQGMPGSIPRVFYEQIKFRRYDISEMSLSSFLRMRSVGWPYRMLPVYHNRNFTHTAITIRQNGEVRKDHPEDLKGKRFGIGDYQQTLGLWIRGILQMEFGVKPEDLTWFQERGEHFSHTGAAAEAGLKLPVSVTIHHARSDLGTMYSRGELDAAAPAGLGASSGSGIDRHSNLSANPDVTTLFSDPRQEAVRFYRKTGLFPPHHVTVVRESILTEHPWVALSLMEAFETSKKLALARLNALPPSLMVFGEHFLKDVAGVLGPDPYAYGIKANARALDMAQDFSLQQGLTLRKQPLEELFPQEVIYLEERD